MKNSFVDCNVNEENFVSDAAPNTSKLTVAEVRCLALIYEAFKSSDWLPWDASETTEEDLVIAGVVPTASIPIPIVDWVSLFVGILC